MLRLRGRLLPLRLRVCQVFIVLAFVALPLHPAGASPRVAATVIALRGALTVQAGGLGPARAIGLQAPLSVGDVIHTGPDGEAALLFRDGSQLKLRANSSLRITPSVQGRQEQSLFQALFGVIWAHLRPGQKIETPSANIVVRGTEVLLAVAPDGTTTLTVTEGDVSFFNAQGAVEVTASQQSTARTGQAPSPPVAVDVSGLIAWTADVVGLPLEFEMPSPPPGAPGIPAGPPADAASWVRLGEAQRRQGNLPAALAAFAQAEQLSPGAGDARVGTALIYLSQGREAAARASLEPVRAQATARAVLGLADLHDGRSADAVSELSAALAADPKLSAARALLAVAYLTRNRLPEADREAHAAALEQPDSAQAVGTLALVLFFEGKNIAAEAAARRAVRLNPLSPFALLAEGRALLAGQQTDAARAAYETAAALAPYLWLIHQELGLVYLRLDHPKKAEEEYRIALGRNPASADAHTGLGLALARQGRFADAERQHRQALVLDPNNGTAHANLAAFLIERGRLDDARRELETGVRAAPERGILYARLAELSLYRQDLFAAQEFARRAVRLLPGSAVAHYELGRVYLEQERTVQAEQEFRQATTLDRQFAAARFALGLTEETAEAGRDPAQPLGAIAAASQSGASGALNIQNLQTAGAEERIQAAIQDPTVVRTASRSFGDAQFDTRVGERGTRDFDLSYLHDSPDQRGEAGLTAQHFRSDGVRDNAGTNEERVTATLGAKAQNSPDALFLLGQIEQTHLGLNTGIESDPFSMTARAVVNKPFALAGFSRSSSEGERTRALVEYDAPKLDDTDAFGSSRFRFRSVHAEVRQDWRLGTVHQFSAGAALGERRRDVNDLLLPLFPDDPTIQDQVRYTAHAAQGYVRDEITLSPKTMLIGEIRVYRLRTDYHSETIGLPEPLPASDETVKTTVGLPALIVTFQPTPSSGLRLRARRLFGGVQDFDLLSPRDIFLFSDADVPTLAFFGTGWRYDLEYDQTFHNASFARLVLFQQDLKDSLNSIGESLAHTRFRGLRASYEGILSPKTTFFLEVNLNDAQAVVNLNTGQTSYEGVSGIPHLTGKAGVQYLDQAGWFLQSAYGYVGSRLQTADASARFGGFDVLTLRMGKRSGLRFSAYIELGNALNRKYAVAAQGQKLGELQPGRHIQAGMTFRF